MTNQPAFYDTECFPNYWLLRIRPQRSVTSYRFALRAGESFDAPTAALIRATLDNFLIVSFNGIYYDVPMITAALAGWSCEQLKWLNDEIIIGQKKPWELGLPEWKPRDHIDIIEVLPGAGSQKTYAGRIHCKTMRDLPYEPNRYLNEEEIVQVDEYCDNDLNVLESLFVAVTPQLEQRKALSERYGMDLRSKSDAQLAEAVIKRRCEQALGQRIFKPEIDWNMKFRYTPPAFLSFSHPELQRAFQAVKDSVFSLGGSGAVVMPPLLTDLSVKIGEGVYRLGIGGLHSSEKTVAYRSDATYVLRDADVASYYPTLILNSGEYPEALGPVFLEILRLMVDERLSGKAKEKALKKIGDIHGIEYLTAHVDNEGGKIMINGTFGKTGSPFSILFAPKMLIQTTVTGQLSLLMLIEWHEHYGIQVVSANTDGLLIRCRRDQVYISDALITEWQKRTGLTMEISEYRAIYSRDVNNYIAIKADGGSKRKGAYSTAGLIEKKNPDVEICGDAVTALLADGTPLLYTVANCRDIRKFVTMQKVAGGAVKLWGEGPRKEMKVRDMTPVLLANGWEKSLRKWFRADSGWTDATTAYQACFERQIPEFLGKVIRWYYSTQAPGPIVYNTNGNQVSLSYGAKPCMTLPDEFPNDIDYNWYLETCEGMLRDLGYYELEGVAA